MEIHEKNIVHQLGKLRGNPNLSDRKKYYHFHRDYDYDTEECRMLKEKIETLIRKDYLNKYKREY